MNEKKTYAIVIVAIALMLAVIVTLCFLAVAFIGVDNGLIAELFGDKEKDTTPVYPGVNDVVIEDSLHDTQPSDPFVSTDQQTQQVETKTEPVESETEPKFSLDGEDIGDWDLLENKVRYTFDHSKLQVIQGDLTENDGFTMCMTTDSEYLYFGFEVSDRTVANSKVGSVNGDCFIITMDLGQLCQSAGASSEPVTYTFGKCVNGCIGVGINVPGVNGDNKQQYLNSYDAYQHKRAVIGAVRVKTQIEGAKIAQIGWTAEFGIKWDLLIENLEQNHGATLEEFGIQRNKLYAVIEVTYVDMDKSGNFIKSYSISQPITLILYPDEMRVVSPD